MTMRPNGTAERIANEICWALASNLGPNTDCQFLEEAIENAVRLDMADSPHCQQLDDPEKRLAARIRLDVETILAAYNIERPLLDRLCDEIEQAVHVGLGGSAPADAWNWQ